jgi:protein phosphatase 2C family protein 2/3
MGDTLSKPVTEKHSQRFESDRLKCGASEMQGWRRGMEDAHTCLLDLEGSPGHAFFAVFDGHCGRNVAQYCGEHLHKRISSSKEFGSGGYESAIRTGFLGIDSDLLAEPKLKDDPSGCTAVAALMTPTHLYVGNAGDSRCVLCTNGQVKALSEDHKPYSEGEMERIRKAGSFVSGGRVNRNLALSRAIGDFDFKKNASLKPEEQAITADPEIRVHELTPEDEFLVLACDGIWDVKSNAEVCAFVRKELLNHNEDLASICEKVFDECLAPAAPGLGCDNMTMVIVLFVENWNRRKAGLYAQNNPGTGSTSPALVEVDDAKGK